MASNLPDHLRVVDNQTGLHHQFLDTSEFEAG
jgi:hypothetical protein